MSRSDDEGSRSTRGKPHGDEQTASRLSLFGLFGCESRAAPRGVQDAPRVVRVLGPKAMAANDLTEQSTRDSAARCEDRARRASEIIHHRLLVRLELHGPRIAQPARRLGPWPPSLIGPRA